MYKYLLIRDYVVSDVLPRLKLWGSWVHSCSHRLTAWRQGLSIAGHQCSLSTHLCLRAIDTPVRGGVNDPKHKVLKKEQL